MLDLQTTIISEPSLCSVGGAPVSKGPVLLSLSHSGIEGPRDVCSKTHWRITKPKSKPGGTEENQGTKPLYGGTTRNSQTSPGPEQMGVQKPGTPGLKEPHSGLCHQHGSGSAVLPFSALLTGVARFSLLCDSEEEVHLP